MKVRFNMMFVIALCVISVVCSAAFAAAPDAEVKGLWLTLPAFPEDAKDSTFAAEPNGDVTYTRTLYDGDLSLTIRRYYDPEGKMNPEGAKEIVERYLQDKDEKELVTFKPQEEHFADLKYPCASAFFTYEADGKARAESWVFIFTDEYYYFIIEISIDPNLSEKVDDLSAKLNDWMSLKFTDGKESSKDKDEPMAVLYTAVGFEGSVWEICQTGEYDLWKGFDLPSDSICSVRVRPGYRVVFYEHSEFKGKSEAAESDVGDMGEWNRYASSLKVERTDEAKEWLESLKGHEPTFAESELDDDEMAEALKKHASELKEFNGILELHWYGANNDSGRVKKAGKMLELFEKLGFDVSDWTPNTFAQQINNFYDWKKNLNLWETACLVLNVDARRMR